MKTLIEMVSRNRKLFFRDKGMLMSSLITPVILIVLYATFLSKVYKESFIGNMPEFFDVPEKLINGTVAGLLGAALLAVCCVTVTFCVNLTMIQDIYLGVRKDFDVSPIKTKTLYLSYLVSTVCNSLMVNFVALGLCLAYTGLMGWYLTVTDVLLLIADVILIVLFGAVISGIICYPLKTQGAMSTVGTIVSAGYGFLCGAYMPISNFGKGLQRVLSFLPGTYATSLIKNHMLRGVLEEMEAQGFPKEAIDGIAKSLDCRPEFFDKVVAPRQMMLILVCSVLVFGAVYFVLTGVKKKK